MKTYIIRGKITLNAYAEISARDEEEAQELMQQEILDYAEWDTAELDITEIEMDSSITGD